MEAGETAKTTILSQALVKPLLQRAKPIKYLVLSDIHLGHKRNRASEIIANLRSFFRFADSPYKDIDILFIAGDLYDQAMWFNNPEVVEILMFMNDLMHWCQSFGIKLRILEGTPSHDRHQPRNLVPLANSYTCLDFRYIDTMAVEAFHDLGITCLYVPDEFAGSAKKAQELIQEELDRLGLSCVDIAIMHGMFRYQLPEISSDRYKYDEEFFLRVVKAYINIGHVHIPSTFERILVQGSFDRLAQGEEHNKGAMLMELNQQEGNSFYFLKNERAKTFITLHVKFKDFDRSMEFVRNRLIPLRDHSYVRIKASRGHPILNVIEQLQRDFSLLFFDKITEEEEQERKELVDTRQLLNVEYTPVHIHKDNIIPMILEGVKARHTFHPHQLDLLEAKLKEIKV